MKLARAIACSWSGGKDSCLALHTAVEHGATPRALLTMFDESGERSRSHGLHREILQAHASAMNVPLYDRRASWSTYEEQFVDALTELRESSIRDIVFGDIDLEDHRKWEERVCARSDVMAHLPLWLQPRQKVLQKCWAIGIRCQIIAVDASCLSEEVLGSELTPSLASEFEARGVDACGENGEFHTVVTDAPLFDRQIELEFGDVVSHGGYLAIDARLARTRR